MHQPITGFAYGSRRVEICTMTNCIGGGIDKVGRVWPHEAVQKVRGLGDSATFMGLQLHSRSKDNGFDIPSVCTGFIDIPIPEKSG